MTLELDHFDVHQKQLYVIIGTTIGLVLSNVTTVLRVWAKLMVVKTLQREDWFMISGLFLSFGIAASLFYGQLFRGRRVISAGQVLTGSIRAYHRFGAKYWQRL